MEKHKILWVQDEFCGPMTGVVSYNDELLWFSRVNIPQIISSTDINPDETEDRNNYTYSLYRLSPEKMDSLWLNHQDYCEKTGAPLHHGDPHKLKRKIRKIVKDPPEKLVPKDKEYVELEHRAIMDHTTYTHITNTIDVKGEFVITINEKEFSNYSVSRRVEVEN
jgi:hypothetical protein